MPHRFLAFVATAAVLLSPTACIPPSCPDACNPGQTTVTVTEQDAGTTVTLCVGDSLQVALQGTPATGFGWYPAFFDTTILEQEGDWECPPGDSPSSPFAGGDCPMTVEFKAMASGQMLLQMIYHRVWEPDVPPAKTFEITVVVSNR